MILKRKDFRRLMRGYDFDKKKFTQLLETYQEKENKFTDLFEELEKEYPEESILDRFTEYVRDIQRPDKEYPEAFALLSNYMDEAQDASRKCISYKGGKILSSIVEYYKSSGKRYIDIANNYMSIVVEEKIPLPKVEGSDEELLDFSDCNTEEEVFKWTQDKFIEIMSATIPKPVEIATTKGISDLLVNIDKGYWGLSMGGLTLKAGETVSIGLGRQGSDSIVRTIQLSPKSLESGIPELNLTPYDSAILTIISQLKLKGNDIISVSTIAKALKGNKEGHISEKMKQEILSSIIKMMCLITIDYTSEATHYKFGRDTKSYYYGMLLPVELDVTVNLNGNIIHDGIRILRVPILFELALLKAQVTSLPLSAIAYRGYTTKRIVSLSSYLMQRVGAMKPTKCTKKIKGKMVVTERQKPITIRTIKVDSLLEITIPDKRKDRDEKSNQLKKAEAILQQYKEDGIIYGFCFNYAGKDAEQDEKKQKYIIAMNKKQEREMWEKL